MYFCVKKIAVTTILSTLLPLTCPAADASPTAQTTPQISPDTDQGEIDFIQPFGGDDARLLKDLANSVVLDIHGGDAVTPAGPPEFDPQHALALGQAVSLAFQNNNELHAAIEKYAGAQIETSGAKWQYYPSLEVIADTGTERSAPAAYNDSNGNRVLDNTHQRDDLNFTLRQPLIDLGIFADIKINRSKEAVALAEKQDITDTVTVDTVNAYLGIVQSQMGVQLAEQYIAYLRKLENTMRIRVEAGGAAPADLDRISGRTMKAEATLIEAQGEYQTQAMEFRRLTSADPRQLQLPDALAPAIPASIQAAVEQALQYNNNYQATLRKVELADNERSKALTGLAPKLSLQYNDSYSYNAGGVAQGNPVDGLFPTQKTQSLMLTLQWSIYGGNAIAGGMTGAAKVREMNYRALDAHARIEQAVRASYTAINAARKRRDVLARNVEANARVAENFDTQFLSGARSLFDLIDAQEQLYTARINLIRAVVIGAKSCFELRRLMGDVVPAVATLGRE